MCESSDPKRGTSSFTPWGRVMPSFPSQPVCPCHCDQGRDTTQDHIHLSAHSCVINYSLPQYSSKPFAALKIRHQCLCPHASTLMAGQDAPCKCLTHLKDFQLISWSVGFAFFPTNWNTIKSGCFLNIKQRNGFFPSSSFAGVCAMYIQAICCSSGRFNLFLLLSVG